MLIPTQPIVLNINWSILLLLHLPGYFLPYLKKSWGCVGDGRVVLSNCDSLRIRSGMRWLGVYIAI